MKFCQLLTFHNLYVINFLAHEWGPEVWGPCSAEHVRTFLNPAPNSLDACASTVRTMSSRFQKAASAEFGLRSGSGRLVQADGPAVAKARRRPYVLSR